MLCCVVRVAESPFISLDYSLSVMIQVALVGYVNIIHSIEHRKMDVLINIA